MSDALDELHQQIADLFRKILGNMQDLDFIQLSDSFITAFYVNQKYAPGKKISFSISDGGVREFLVTIEIDESGDRLLSLKSTEEDK